MRLNVRSTVVLPHPDGPMKAVISCSCIASETSVTALKALYQIETFFTSKMALRRAADRPPLVLRRATRFGPREVGDRVFCSGGSMTFLARVSGESCGNKAGDDHEDEGDRDERERRAPAAGLGADIRR